MCVHACCVYAGGRSAGGWGGCCLIPEENVEEINLNYKDEASLESGTGRATEERRVRGREKGDQLFLFFFFGWCFLVIFFLFSPSSCGNEVVCLPSSLACHADAPPSLAHEWASFQLVSIVATAGVDKIVETPQSLFSSWCSLLTDNRCFGFSGNT